MYFDEHRKTTKIGILSVYVIMRTDFPRFREVNVLMNGEASSQDTVPKSRSSREAV